MTADLGGYVGVILDVDGTLVDTNYVHTLCWWQAFSQSGFRIPMWRLHRAIGMGADLLMDRMLEGTVDRERRQQVVTAHDVLFATWRDVVQPLPGARALLHWCWEQQVTTVVASSSGRLALEAMLDVLGRPDVDYVISGDDVTDAKPKPELLNLSIDRSGLSRDSTAVVGDSVWDVEAAQRAGLPCFGLTCGGTSAQELLAAGAVGVLTDPAELLGHWRSATARQLP